MDFLKCAAKNKTDHFLPLPLNCFIAFSNCFLFSSSFFFSTVLLLDMPIWFEEKKKSKTKKKKEKLNPHNKWRRRLKFSFFLFSTHIVESMIIETFEELFAVRHANKNWGSAHAIQWENHQMMMLSSFIIVYARWKSVDFHSTNSIVNICWINDNSFFLKVDFIGCTQETWRTI